MRLLIISDSHGRYEIADRIIEKNKDAEHVFFLGDKTEDIEECRFKYPNKVFHIVKGNCDMFSKYPNCEIIKIENTNIFFCHGHTFSVKFTKDILADHALKNNCALALFGHTHEAYEGYVNGVYLVNPGSCAEPRDGKGSYAVIDIRDNGILASIIRI